MEDQSIHNHTDHANVDTLLARDIPYKLGKYEIQNELGQGVSGIVYKGYDPFVRRDVAIKVGWNDAAIEKQDSPAARLDFFAEAHAAGRLQHPNIVALYDAHKEKELSYIVMEYIQGQTLSHYCGNRKAKLSDEKILEIIIKCCQALHFTHSMGVIHRDIKPANIMLTDEGETKIMDFGVAEISNKSPVSSDNIIGTPSYMSPEQILRKNIGAQSDLYSVAAVAYNLFTGEKIFYAEDISSIFQQVLKTKAPPLNKLRPDLPTELANIISKALSKSPTNRFHNGNEMAAALSAIYEKITYQERTIEFGEFSDILQNLRFFNEFNKSQIQELLTIGNMLAFNKGEIIDTHEAIDNSFYIVVQGSVIVSKADKCALILSQNDCYGESLQAPTETDKGAHAQLISETNSVILKINAVRIETIDLSLQLLFYKAFCQNLIQRLTAAKSAQA